MSELTKAGSNISNDNDTTMNTKSTKQSCFSKTENLKLIKNVKDKLSTKTQKMNMSPI